MYTPFKTLYESDVQVSGALSLGADFGALESHEHELLETLSMRWRFVAEVRLPPSETLVMSNVRCLVFLGLCLY